MERNGKKLIELQERTGNLNLFESIRNAQHKHRKQRSRLEIIADILTVAWNGAKKTEIVYKANLNFTRLKSYLAYLESNGLLEHSGTVYTTTARGKEFLREYHQMEENLQT